MRLSVIMSASLAFLTCTLSAQSQPATAPADPQATLTVATYNVNYGLRGAPALKLVVDTIRKTQADVVAIQEGNDETWAYLGRQLAQDYPHMKVHRSVWLAGGTAWLSKRELLRDRVIAGGENSFDAYLVEVQMASRNVLLATLHLCPSVVKEDAGWGGMVDEFVRTEEIRLREIRQIASTLPPGPAVIAGDFNSLPSFVAPRYLAAKGYIDSFASANPGKNLQPTWEWPGRGGKWRLRLDYVYHTADFRTLESRVIEAGPSDHYPVVSKLELLPRPTTQPAAK